MSLNFLPTETKPHKPGENTKAEVSSDPEPATTTPSNTRSHSDRLQLLSRRALLLVFHQTHLLSYLHARSSKGKWNPYDRTTTKEQENSYGTERKKRWVKRQASILMGIKKGKKKSHSAKKEMFFFVSAVAGSYSSWRSESQMLEPCYRWALERLLLYSLRY